MPTGTRSLTSGCPADGTEVFTVSLPKIMRGAFQLQLSQALFEKRFSHGLQFQASYTYSKSLDTGLELSRNPDPTNFSANLLPLALRCAASLRLNYVWELPFKVQGLSESAEWRQVLRHLYLPERVPLLIHNCDDVNWR